MTNEIRLYSGGYFCFERLDVSEVTIEDIAHSLSNICRFTGHCNVPYSVAQHSVLVSSLIARSFQDPDFIDPELLGGPDRDDDFAEDHVYREAYNGLMHDAQEALIGDLSTPFKNILPEYVAFERRIKTNLGRKFKFPEVDSLLVRQADRVALLIEQRDLMGVRHPPEIAAELPRISLTPLSQQLAKDLFLSYYRDLAPEDPEVKFAMDYRQPQRKMRM